MYRLFYSPMGQYRNVYITEYEDPFSLAKYYNYLSDGWAHSITIYWEEEKIHDTYERIWERWINSIASYKSCSTIEIDPSEDGG